MTDAVVNDRSMVVPVMAVAANGTAIALIAAIIATFVAATVTACFRLWGKAQGAKGEE
jgi:hypothetical protein